MKRGLRQVLAMTLAAFLGFGIHSPLLAQKKQKKNADLENVGNREINKRNLNFYSIERENRPGQAAIHADRAAGQAGHRP